jgi:hypothetical protein
MITTGFFAPRTKEPKFIKHALDALKKRKIAVEDTSFVAEVKTGGLSIKGWKTVGAWRRGLKGLHAAIDKIEALILSSIESKNIEGADPLSYRIVMPAGHLHHTVRESHRPAIYMFPFYGMDGSAIFEYTMYREAMKAKSERLAEISTKSRSYSTEPMSREESAAWGGWHYKGPKPPPPWSSLAEKEEQMSWGGYKVHPYDDMWR